jgi:hypothetical protein
MAESRPTLAKRLRFRAVGQGLKLLAWSINRARSKDPWLERALDQFHGVWRFESGDHILAWHLVLEGGKFAAVKDPGKPANFTFTLYNPSDISLRVRPEHVLEVLIANKIGQSGDLHYLYQFGFIMSLFRRTTRFHGKSIPIGG